MLYYKEIFGIVFSIKPKKTSDILPDMNILMNDKQLLSAFLQKYVVDFNKHNLQEDIIIELVKEIYYCNDYKLIETTLKDLRAFEKRMNTLENTIMDLLVLHSGYKFLDLINLTSADLIRLLLLEVKRYSPELVKEINKLFKEVYNYSKNPDVDNLIDRVLFIDTNKIAKENNEIIQQMNNL